MSEPWLEALDAKVQAAAAEIQRLRAVNRELSHRLAEVEARLATAETTTAPEAAAAWESERTAIKERVESLVGKLEDLLAEQG